jgi:hypothetical protein
MLWCTKIGAAKLKIENCGADGCEAVANCGADGCDGSGSREKMAGSILIYNTSIEDV